jgi:lysophospholipase L1-like esterase
MPKKDTYILDRPTGRPLRARDGMICIFLAALLLVVLKGHSIRNQGEKLDPGVERTVLVAVGGPAGWIADRVGVDDNVDRLTASLSPDESLTGPGGFASTPISGGAGSGATAAITKDSFDPVQLGDKPVLLPHLKTLLVTGDSLSQPLDEQLARNLAGDGVKTIRDAHIGTAISKTDIVDWGLLSKQQTKQDKPDAVVMFMGANEGFPFPAAGGKSINCCGVAWAVAYATRVRQMIDTYRRNGAARVYWLTVPGPRDPARQTIARAVNAAIDVAAEPFRSQVRVLDMNALFTPGGKYRAAMPVAGRNTIVRRPDGIHLNDAGAGVAKDDVIAHLKADFKQLG